MKDIISTHTPFSYKKLPDKVLALITSFLQATDITTCLLVCKHWLEKCKTEKYCEQILGYSIENYKNILNEEMLLTYYANQLYSVFDANFMEEKLTAELADTDDRDETIDEIVEKSQQINILAFFEGLTSSLQVKLMQQFFKQFPEFDINSRTSHLDQDSLPLILYDWDQQSTLTTVLSQHHYDKGKKFGDRSLDEAMENPPQYQIKQPKPVDEETALTIPALRMGCFATTTKEVLQARHHARNLYHFFDEKFIQTEIKKFISDPVQVGRLFDQTKIDLSDIKQKEEVINHVKSIIFEKLTTPLTRLSESMQLMLIREFLKLYPEFNIQQRTTIYQQTLPILLFNCKLEHARNYLLSIKPYASSSQASIDDSSLVRNNFQK